MTNRAVLIYSGVFAAAFGLLVYWMSRRKGLPAAGLTTFLGIAGVYTGFWAVTERRHWLYAPAVVLRGQTRAGGLGSSLGRLAAAGGCCQQAGS